MRPCVWLGTFVFNEPLGSLLVFGLAFLWIAVGIEFLRARGQEQSRLWLGIALVLGGVGAAQAGISYQAFSYMLKCADRDLCLLTNGFEVGYSITQALSVSAMLIAVAYSCATRRLRMGLIAYAVVNAIAYVGVSVVGVMRPDRQLLSFEVLMLFALPGILLVMLLTGRPGQATKQPASRGLFIASLLLLLVQVAYFSYAAADLTQTFWQEGQGFYFSANDVLHVGMIGWLLYIRAMVGGELRDLKADL